jgi:hypothetical protein
MGSLSLFLFFLLLYDDDELESFLFFTLFYYYYHFSPEPFFIPTATRSQCLSLCPTPPPTTAAHSSLAQRRDGRMERVARSLAPSSSVRLLARLHLYSLSSSKKETDYKIEGGGI